MSSKEWKTYKLGEIATFYNGRAYKNEEFKSFGTPIVRIQNLTGEGKTVYSDLNLDENKYIDFEDLIYAWSATFGPYLWKGNKSIYHYHIWKIECNKRILDKHYFYYKLKYISDALKGGGNGTLFTHITKFFIENFEVSIPDITIQEKTASILRALDDKIELNRQTNQTLEEIAQTLFQEMCVPKVEELPEGWRVSTIGDIATNVQYGYTESSSKELIGPKFLRITDIQGGNVEWSQVPYCKIDEKNFEKYKIQDHDIFVARTGASTGENIYIIDAEVAVFASYLIRIQFEKPEQAFFIGKFMRRQEYFNYISLSLGGSAQPNANAKTLTNIEVIVPNSDVLKNYFNTAFPLQQKIVRNEQENQTLIALRDSLLPKLMKGEIEI